MAGNPETAEKEVGRYCRKRKEAIHLKFIVMKSIKFSVGLFGIFMLISFETKDTKAQMLYGGTASVVVKCTSTNDRYCTQKGDTRVIITEVGCRFTDEAAAIGKLNEELNAKMASTEVMDSEVEYLISTCEKGNGQNSQKYGGTASVQVQCYKVNSSNCAEKGDTRIIITEVGCRFADEAAAIGKLNEELNAKMASTEKMSSNVTYRISTCGN